MKLEKDQHVFPSPVSPMNGLFRRMLDAERSSVEFCSA
jgi:hypothetical protein